MAASWFERDPAFYEQVKEEVLAAFPQLRFETRSGKVWLAGPFMILGERGVEVTRYEIAVRLPSDFPKTIPDLFEVGGRIGWTAEEHTFRNGRACLFVPGERWQHWPLGSTLVEFLQGVVRSHLVGHAHYEAVGNWPWGERSHGAEGIFESYAELLGTEDREVIRRYLNILAHAQPKGHWECPCGSGQRLRKCHREGVFRLRGRITTEEAKLALEHTQQP